LPDDDAFSHLSARFRLQDLYLAAQNPTKIYQKCIRRRVLRSFDEADFFEPKSFSRRAYRQYVQGER